TDADRERFKVKRRFQMRDGERFFADGRDNAVFDLSQKQMKKAANWRTALRRSVLNELAQLGREPRLFQRYSPYREYNRLVIDNASIDEREHWLYGPMGEIGGRLNEPAGLGPLGDREELGIEAREFDRAERQTGIDEFFSDHQEVTGNKGQNGIEGRFDEGPFEAGTAEPLSRAFEDGGVVMQTERIYDGTDYVLGGDIA